MAGMLFGSKGIFLDKLAMRGNGGPTLFVREGVS
jgi:hypothetical protein